MRHSGSLHSSAAHATHALGGSRGLGHGKTIWELCRAQSLSPEVDVLASVYFVAKQGPNKLFKIETTVFVWECIDKCVDLPISNITATKVLQGNFEILAV